MRKVYLILGILALLVSLVGVRADLQVIPDSQGACCENLQYRVIVSNDYINQISYTLEADSLDTDSMWVSLEPGTVLVPGRESQELLMFVRPDCDLASGEYRVRVTMEHLGNCDEVCGDLCTYEDGHVDVKVVIGADCIVVEPIEPEPEPVEPEPVEPENTTPQINQTDAPTGAVVSSDNDYTVIGVLFILLGLFIIMLVLIQRQNE